MTVSAQPVRAIGPWTWLLANRHRWWIRQLPNLLTMLRIGVPFCVVGAYHAYSQGALGQATAWMLAGGALTAGDIFDGPLARVLRAESDFGRLADPALDKAVSASLLITYALSITRGSANQALITVCLSAIALILFLELSLVVLALGGVFSRSREGSRVIPGANRWGKLKFRWSCIGMALGYVMLYWGGPEKLWTSAVTLSACLAAASVCAVLSIIGHLTAHRLD